MQELDFVTVVVKNEKNRVKIFPTFKVIQSKDLMIRGGEFYAIWDEEKGYWSTNEMDVQRLCDNMIRAKVNEYPENFRSSIHVSYLADFSSNQWNIWKNYIKKSVNNYVQLDNSIVFASDPYDRKLYSTHRLNYDLTDGEISAYQKLMGTIYAPDELRKLEWSIGAIVSGDSKEMQKFIVIYGAGGTGKSTYLNLINELFTGYCQPFDAKSLGSGKDQFATSIFSKNPLIAIQQDGDLSNLVDNTKLNSIISHDVILVNEKFQRPYPFKPNSFLFMATNTPVRITDAKSGLVRRIIDVYPSGKTVPHKEYLELIEKMKFEYGAIAKHCLEVYSDLGGKYAYDEYRPSKMIHETYRFYDFMDMYGETFAKEEYTTLQSAFQRYKEYCDFAQIKDYERLSRQAFKNELSEYFNEYYERYIINDERKRNVFIGYKTTAQFNNYMRERQRTDSLDISSSDVSNDTNNPVPKSLSWLTDLDKTESIFDDMYAASSAQYASKNGKPLTAWDDVKTVLADLDTKKIHFVRVPIDHIVIDFDIQNADGTKNLEKNLEAASKFPPTYAELSKSGRGVHLHYIYDGDPELLSRVYDDNIEIKVFSGKSSLRRKLTYCNDRPIAHISSGLPKVERKGKLVSDAQIRSEKGLRSLIERCMQKEFSGGGTKPNVEFIKKILDESYENPNLHYDISDMRNDILQFAAGSTHHSAYCVGLVADMKFYSEEPSAPVESENKELVFFDVEVFPNLFVIVWKTEGCQPVKMINPTPAEVDELRKYNLVGFNNRKYDNHILYARILGYSNEELYHLSTKIVKNVRDAGFIEAYNLSYTDVFDFSSKKQSLKKFEIELGIHHQELGLRWDESVPENMWETVAEYCVNDVVATEATFKARHEDFVAREILAALSGLTVNDTNNQHTARIIFGKDKHPQTQFIYTDLATGDQYPYPDMPNWVRNQIKR